MENHPLQRVKAWFASSISRKLALFLMLVSLALIALVWILEVVLLEPAYNAAIQGELYTTLDSIVTVLDRADAEQVELVTLCFDRADAEVQLSDECVRRISAEISGAAISTENLCIDISTPDHGQVLVRDNLVGNCALHPEGTPLQNEQPDDNPLADEFRQMVLGGEELLSRGERHITVGRAAAGGKVAVILTANLDRVSQASLIFVKLMLYVSVALLIAAFFAAVLFSRWFTRPLCSLSKATKEIARGNYNVEMPVKGEDEIAQLSQDFNQMAKDVQRSVDLQRDLIANVSHDLRTPLTLIKGYAETVRDITGDNKEKRTEQLNIIVDESDRLSTLVGSVMELSKVSSGSEKPKLVRFNLAQLCEEVGERYEGVAAQRQLNLEYSGPDSLEVEADPALIERALHNLLGNALNHVGEDGFIGLRVYKKDPRTARVEVCDHGPGIPPQDLPHIYERFYRSRSDQGKTGTGLGLSITKAIFEAHGFPYGVNSDVGKGSSFWFEVPI